MYVVTICIIRMKYNIWLEVFGLKSFDYTLRQALIELDKTKKYQQHNNSMK